MSGEKAVYIEEWECAVCDEPCSIIARRSQYYGQRPEINGDGGWDCLCTDRAMNKVEWKLISFAPRRTA